MVNPVTPRNLLNYGKNNESETVSAYRIFEDKSALASPIPPFKQDIEELNNRDSTKNVDFVIFEHDIADIFFDRVHEARV